MIVLSEASDRLAPSASARDLEAGTNAARLAGCLVYTIPPDLDVCENAQNALAHVPAPARATPGAWIGYIPSPERYAAIYDEARRKNIYLLNTLEQHQNAQEFPRAYERLGALTPPSVIITGESECAAAVEALGLPVFVKGAIQSRKSRGWSACVANSLDELRTLTRHLLALENRSRGRVVVRRLARLRHVRTSAQGFPLGREFRAFVYREQIIGLGYYWEGNDPLKTLAPVEEDAVRRLAGEAARRVGTPYLTVDIGQQDDGEWIVIETGDAQFSGVSQVPLLVLWNRLRVTAEEAIPGADYGEP